MLLHVFDSVLLWTSTQAFSMVVLLILQALIFHIVHLILTSVRGMHMEGFLMVWCQGHAVLQWCNNHNARMMHACWHAVCHRRLAETIAWHSTNDLFIPQAIVYTKNLQLALIVASIKTIIMLVLSLQFVAVFWGYVYQKLFSSVSMYVHCYNDLSSMLQSTSNCNQFCY